MATKLLITSLAASMLFFAANVEAAKELYRWTDENGVVHYSDTKPANAEYERRDVAADPVKPSSAEAGAAATKAGEPATPSAAAADSEPSESCVKARANVDVLEKSSQVSMDLDNDGTPEVLAVDEQQRQLVRQRELAKLLCNE